MPKDLTTRQDTAVIELTRKQMEQIRPVLNNSRFENNGMVLAQIRNGEARVRWIPPFKARIIYTVARLLGIGRVY